MADRDPIPSYVVTTGDHSGLEPVPMTGLEPMHQSWHYQQQKELYSPQTGVDAPERAYPPIEPGQRILGLSVRTFWIIVIALVVIVAAAIGGGVGGGLAAQSRANSSSPTAADQGATSSASSTPPTSELSRTSNPTTTTKTDTPTSTTARAGGVSPAPTDEGCPNINGTAYTPVDASGKAIPLSGAAGGAAQSFLRYCDTNWPSGPDYGNPRIHDIMKLYLPSLEACITACAAYNFNYEANRAKGIGSQEGGLCRAVSIVKTDGEYCYLKNNTGKVDTFGQPKLFSSAILYMASGNVVG